MEITIHPRLKTLATKFDALNTATMSKTKLAASSYNDLAKLTLGMFMMMNPIRTLQYWIYVMQLPKSNLDSLFTASTSTFVCMLVAVTSSEWGDKKCFAIFSLTGIINMMIALTHATKIIWMHQHPIEVIAALLLCVIVIWWHWKYVSSKILWLLGKGEKFAEEQTKK